MFMSSIEQRSANIDIDEIYNKKKRKRKSKKKKEEDGHTQAETVVGEDVEFNAQDHMREQEKMHEGEDEDNADIKLMPFEMQPVE